MDPWPDQAYPSKVDGTGDRRLSIPEQVIRREV